MLTILLFLILAPVVFYVVHSAFKYTRMISNIFLSLVYDPELEFTPSSRGEKITILDSSDQEIEALLVESKNSDKVVIFCHESGAAKESWERYAYFFPESGFNVLSIDFGKNTGDEINALNQWPLWENVQRLLTAARWTKTAFGAHVQIVLFGVSNGADLALAASFEEASIIGVVTDGLFSMKEIFRDYIRKWAPILVKPNLFGQNYPSWVVNIFTELGFWYCQKKTGKKFVEVEGLLQKKHKPLLMIHGENDDYVPGSHQKYLEKMNGENDALRRLVIPNAKHNQAVVLGADIYRKSISDFVTSLSGIGK